MSRYDDDMVGNLAWSIHRFMQNAQGMWTNPAEIAKHALKAAGIVVPVKGEAYCIGGSAHGTIYTTWDRDVMLAPRPMEIALAPIASEVMEMATVKIDTYYLRRLGPYPCEFWVLDGLSDEDARYLVPRWLK